MSMNKVKLSKEQAQLLRFVYDRQQAIFSGLLSTFAHEHGATVNEHTQFSLNSEMDEIDIVQKTDNEPSEAVVQSS